MPEGVRELGELMMQVGIAVKQVMHAGGKTQAAEAAKVLAETRRSLYRILAEDEPDAQPATRRWVSTTFRFWDNRGVLRGSMPPPDACLSQSTTKGTLRG